MKEVQTAKADVLAQLLVVRVGVFAAHSALDDVSVLAQLPDAHQAERVAAIQRHWVPVFAAVLLKVKQKFKN